MALVPNPGCGDTTLTWYQTFDLGVLPPGLNQIQLTLHVESDPAESTAVDRVALIPVFVSGGEVSDGIPNPFVSNTRFLVNTQREENVDVGIYDVHGRRVITLFKGRMEPGTREFRWNGARDDGSRAGIGIYFSRVAFSNRVVTRKLVMLPR
jgi:hypothetical protein